MSGVSLDEVDLNEVPVKAAVEEDENDNIANASSPGLDDLAGEKEASDNEQSAEIQDPQLGSPSTRKSCIMLTSDDKERRASFLRENSLRESNSNVVASSNTRGRKTQLVWADEVVDEHTRKTNPIAEIFHVASFKMHNRSDGGSMTRCKPACCIMS